MIFSFANRKHIPALALLTIFVFVPATRAVVAERDVQVARVLAEKARLGALDGQIVRPYLLYQEAAKRDPDNAFYRQKRNLLEPTARMLIDRNEETADISEDIRAAEHGDTVPSAPSISVFKPSPPVKPVAEAATLPVGNRADAETSSGQGDRSSWHFAFGTQVLGYGTFNSVRNNSVFNPSNQLAAFPEEDFHAALRPDFQLGNSYLSLSAKPRADYDHSFSAAGNNASYYLQEWSARLQLLPSVNISYGREVPLWGPALSVPASNPFFLNNGRNTPLLEIGARDFGRLLWQPNSHFALSYIANTALRRGTPDFLPFQKTAAVKADYIGRNILLSGIYSSLLSQVFGQRKFIGSYLQVSAGKAFRFYVDGSAQQGNPGYYPATSADLPFSGYAQTERYQRLLPRTIIGGLAYTDSTAGTWTGEYIYNPAGYTNSQAAAFFATGQLLSQIYGGSGPYAGLAAEQLSLASNLGLPLLRRQYAFGQYQRNGIARRLDVVLRYTFNAQDHSGQGVAYITWNTSDHFQLFGVFAGMNGSADTEFARYLHYQAQLGFRVFLH